ncbi:hypothetical protein [Kitasatospora sp. NPDC050543]|uniref:hypothetical protein n=1 Tax=Kitasatospora sp. NPDC050543 TaxID=3364054 RepID=UPI003793E162
MAEQDARALRTELDELLRARQYATARERRLTGAVQATDPPDRELLRQLEQARMLRARLGARCLELSEHLLTVEDRLRESAPAPPPAATPARPTGARFGGAYQQAPAAPAPPAPPPAAAPVPPARGARFGGVRPASAPAQHAAPAAAPPTPAPAPAPPPQAERPVAPPPPPPRAQAELVGLAERITLLHARGSTQESAAVTAQAAVTLAPPDVARLAALLRTVGPAGAGGYLARATAHGAPAQAAATLAELRRSGLAEEAAGLFHALWGYPAAGLPALLAALDASGQSADGVTLLWEWGSAPPADLAALAALLVTAGRAADARTLLRQAAARAVPDLAALALALEEQLAPVFLRELVGMRAPADLAALAGALTTRPDRYAALLAALAAGDPGRCRSATAALRSAGLPTAVDAPRARRARR